MPRSDMKPTPDPVTLEPLPRGRRPTPDRPPIFYSGAWRSREGVERVRIRNRLRQRARRVDGTGR